MTQDSADDTILNFDATLFGIRDGIRYTHLTRIREFIESFGYEMKMLDRGYSLEEVQEKLLTVGPSAFLRLMRLQEDILPKAPSKAAWQSVAERLAILGPATELTIVDPFLFSETIKAQQITQYSQQLAALIDSIVTSEASVTCVVDRLNEDVFQATKAVLALSKPDVSISVKQSRHFHDRFWIADRSKGVVVGTSLTGIGKRVFFIDALSTADVGSVVEELDGVGS